MRSSTGCARRRPRRSPCDGGSIPPTSTTIVALELKPLAPRSRGCRVKIDAGSHGTLVSLPHLVDAASGAVHLRLVPLHLSRLHPPDLRGDFVPCGGDATSPYQLPLLKGASPVDVTLLGGMSVSNVSAGVIFECAGSLWSQSWWRWIAYALTPFGWVRHPTPHFVRKQAEKDEDVDLLASLSLAPSCGSSSQENFGVASEWLLRELGSPQLSGDRKAWRFDWGSVVLAYEPRDGFATAFILWEPLHSEMQDEARDRIRSEDPDRGSKEDGA